MKKKILLALLAVGLLAAGLAGGAYAAGSHNPVHGNKLVGFSPFGMKSEVLPGPTGNITHKIYDYCYFSFTNPDCVNDITIERVSIIKGDGTLIDEFTPVIPVLKPHGVRIIELSKWIDRDEPTVTYTVEIEWSAKGGTCPLMGWQHRAHTTIILPPGSGPPLSSTSEIPMLNMKQKAR